MAVDFAFVFVVAVLSAKDRRANGTGEMLDVILSVQRGDVGPAKRAATGIAQEIKASKIVGFT